MRVFVTVLFLLLLATIILAEGKKSTGKKRGAKKTPPGGLEESPAYEHEGGTGKRIKKLEKALKAAIYKLNKITDCEGVYYHGYCYFMLEELVTHGMAEEMCKEKGGMLADLASKSIYSVLRRYVYDMTTFLTPPAEMAVVWVDGIYKNGTVTCRNGSLLKWDLLWTETYPNDYAPTHDRLAFAVQDDTHHLINLEDGYTNFPLCQV